MEKNKEYSSEVVKKVENALKVIAEFPGEVLKGIAAEMEWQDSVPFYGNGRLAVQAIDKEDYVYSSLFTYECYTYGLGK